MLPKKSVNNSKRSKFKVMRLEMIRNFDFEVMLRNIPVNAPKNRNLSLCI